MNPNIFDYATSELSQDAFYCWLISWSEEKFASINPKLYARSKKFIEYLSRTNESLKNIEVENIEIKKQFRKVDFLVIINHAIVILFEDKVNSKNHSDQLF